MEDVHPTLPLIVLNTNRLNTPIIREILIEQIKRKHDPIICFLQYTCLRCNDTKRFKVKKWKKDRL